MAHCIYEFQTESDYDNCRLGKSHLVFHDILVFIIGIRLTAW